MQPWQLLRSEVALSSPWLTVKRNHYQTADGRLLDDFYIVKRRPFVLVVARLQDQLLLVRQYRPATEQFYLALPAGYIEEGEQPETAAQRELLEETGLTAVSATWIGELHPLPGYLNSPAHVVLCEVVDIDTLEFDRAEIDDVAIVAWDEAPGMILSGHINEMQAVAAILLAREFVAAHTQKGQAG